MPRKSMEEKLDEMRQGRTHGERPTREAKSWRERDAAKDRSPHGDQGKPIEGRKPKNRYQEAQANKAARAELDALFRDTEGDALRAAVLGAGDAVALEQALQDWFEHKGELPADGELLEKALDTRKDRTLRRVVEAVGAALPDANAELKKVLLLKLRSKARRSFDAKVSRRCKELLAEYGVQE